MRRGLEGEVKLLVLIDEKGKVRVLDAVSSTHPEFVEPSRRAPKIRFTNHLKGMEKP